MISTLPNVTDHFQTLTNVTQLYIKKLICNKTSNGKERSLAVDKVR